MLHKNDAEIPGDVRYIYAFTNQIDAQMRLRRRLDEHSEIIINDPGNSHCMAANATTMPPMEESDEQTRCSNVATRRRR